MRARIPLVLACAALLAVACQDAPTEPVEQPVATAPEFNFMNNPKDHPVVARFLGSSVNPLDVFEAEGLVVSWGHPMDVFCAGTGGRKGDQNFVTPPSDVGIHVNLQEDEVHLTVFDLATFTNECESEPIFTGMGQLRYILNGYMNTIGRPQVLSHRIHGVVSDDGGNEYRFFLKVFEKYAPDWSVLAYDATVKIH